MEKSLPEAYADTHIQPKHIIPLDFHSIDGLPESHVWTQADDFLSEKCAPQISTNESFVVPIIDLKAPNVVELMGNACKTWGMFQVTYHDVPLTLINDVEKHMQRLFGLPTEQKLKALRSPNEPTGYGMAWISPFFSKLMWHEGFTIMGSAAEHARKLWPQDYREFCDAMDNYQKHMKTLSHKILLLILKALGVDEGDQEMLCSSLRQSNSAMQLNSYPCCPNPDQAIGIAPHTDSWLLTILHQNGIKGLQILREDIGWIDVPPISGALIVNLGDLMHIVSNARFPLVYHRVLPSETSHRFSVAYFFGPPLDSVVAPLARLPFPRYRPVMVKDFISLKNKHLEKALSLLRV